ncbi:unnamed protein product [Protopolystoma xenopodis]|uniref:Uncharacterized protein n=1 Tax=Protopolystoma xenopodis TaxID=117903 RepID=A0A3S4ZZL3_9PLAT|nr:unnamed protein product [Protopolystoma xenopodis]
MEPTAWWCYALDAFSSAVGQTIFFRTHFSRVVGRRLAECALIASLPPAPTPCSVLLSPSGAGHCPDLPIPAKTRQPKRLPHRPCSLHTPSLSLHGLSPVHA